MYGPKGDEGPRGFKGATGPPGLQVQHMPDTFDFSDHLSAVRLVNPNKTYEIKVGAIKIQPITEGCWFFGHFCK